MAEIEDNQDDHHKRRRPSAQTAIDVGPDQESHQEEGAQAGTLTEVASELHSTYGNQLVSSALCSGDSEGLQGAMAAQLGAAVGGLGAWSQETSASNTAMCRAMRHAQAGIEEEPPSAPINLSTGGSHLPEQVRQRMETAMGHDFSHVRIHTGGTAGAQAKQINAHAFTAGSHIYFGSGEFQPGTTQGDRLIAHELTHVIQHDEHRLSLPGTDQEVSRPTDPTEVEAYANEKEVLSELQTVDAALAEGIGDVSMEPARTTGEIVETVASGAAAQAPSTNAGVAQRDMFGGVADAILDAMDMRQDEDRLDAEEELESFMSDSFSVEHFHPSTDLGNFDGQYSPKSGILKVIVGVHFNFLDGDPTVNQDWIDWQARNPAATTPSAAFEWTDPEKGLYAANTIEVVTAAWEGQFTFHNVREHWEALPDVNVQILIVQRDKADAHFNVDVIKWPDHVDGAHIDFPSDTHSHDHSTDIDHVGGEFHETSADAGITTPDTSHFVRNRQTRSGYQEADDMNPETVYFDSEQSELPAGYQMILQNLGRTLGKAAMPPFPVDVIGHTSSWGQKRHNLTLSEERASSVADAIQSGGPKKRPQAIGKGEDGAGLSSEWRRVDIELGNFESDQTTVVHEFGHIFGLDDEYPSADGSGSREVGDEVAHSQMAQNLIEGQQPVVAHHSESVMSNGEDIQPCHYVTFLEMLGDMTNTTGQWSVGPGPGPGVGRGRTSSRARSGTRGSGD